MSSSNKSKIKIREVNNEFTHATYASFKNNSPQKEVLFLSHKQLSFIIKLNEAEYNNTFYQEILSRINDNACIYNKFDPLTPSLGVEKDRKNIKDRSRREKGRSSKSINSILNNDNENIYFSPYKEGMSISKEAKRRAQFFYSVKNYSVQTNESNEKSNKYEYKGRIQKTNSNCLILKKHDKKIQNVAQIQLNSIKEEEQKMNNPHNDSNHHNSLSSSFSQDAAIIIATNNNDQDDHHAITLKKVEVEQSNKRDILILHNNTSNSKQSDISTESNERNHLNKIIEKQEEEQEQDENKEGEKRYSHQKSSCSKEISDNSSKQRVIISKKKKMMLFCCLPLN